MPPLRSWTPSRVGAAALTAAGRAALPVPRVQAARGCLRCGCAWAAGWRASHAALLRQCRDTALRSLASPARPRPAPSAPDYMAEARNVFRNPATTEFVIVTIPTAMAAAESIRLAKALQREQVGAAGRRAGAGGGDVRGGWGGKRGRPGLPSGLPASLRAAVAAAASRSHAGRPMPAGAHPHADREPAAAAGPAGEVSAGAWGAGAGRGGWAWRSSPPLRLLPLPHGGASCRCGCCRC